MYFFFAVFFPTRSLVFCICLVKEKEKRSAACSMSCSAILLFFLDSSAPFHFPRCLPTGTPLNKDSRVKEGDKRVLLHLLNSFTAGGGKKEKENESAGNNSSERTKGKQKGKKKRRMKIHL